MLNSCQPVHSPPEMTRVWDIVNRHIYYQVYSTIDYINLEALEASSKNSGCFIILVSFLLRTVSRRGLEHFASWTALPWSELEVLPKAAVGLSLKYLDSDFLERGSAEFLVAN